MTVLYSFRFSQQYFDSWAKGPASETLLQLIFIAFVGLENYFRGLMKPSSQVVAFRSG